ncbi:MAG: TIGR02452 family protein [Byssovorax sp.]
MSIHGSAQEILDVVRDGRYMSASGAWVDIRAAQAAAEEGAELFCPGDFDALEVTPTEGARPPRIEVIDATTSGAAQALSAEPGGVVLLNFASARNPGGGFLGGARAQEEEVCRCSGLYATLIKQPRYYEANRAQRSALYTDHVIYSPGVPFFRVSAKDAWLDAPFLASVITAPAPNAGAILQNDRASFEKIPETFSRRWKHVLLVAAARRHRTVLLGAWGCGAFRNDPVIAADTVAAWLRGPAFAGCFDRVVFAIPSGGRSADNLAVFRRVLG